MKTEKTANRMTDEELAFSAASGTESAFDELSRRFSGTIEYYARSVMPSGKEISLTKDDFVQYGLLGLVSAAKTYRPDGASFRTYATRCIRNAVFCAARKFRSQLFEHNADVEETDVSVNSAEEDFFLADRVHRVRKLMDTVLTESEREVLELFTEGRSYRDIAEQTGKSIKSVDGAIQRAKRKITVAFKGENK